ncbi:MULTISPECIES: DoxX family membrane protein [Thermomonospora]|uniref:DoxX family protein n=1 Tax=Thermomonospora curvata (strain ATCC 19995 / DSM 43183 / JCM 3096 / KCTC 9072 / NBRC 15933 / NCIMB 10081 / Henssen B9) TaxID=471852 RepID=D1ACI6_THECD|nr:MULTISPECIES: DoxX family membrane protein [Thermomonospora]ACY99245.1 DoxX family protein [Thermomonospora curvata DSM 43183]PKK12309.1 MAG: DoxX family membrane protein [Thermomonospora sp. CIF 1]
MQPIRIVARPLVAAYFIASGVEALRDPRPRAEQMAPSLKPVADRLEWLPAKDPETLVRVQGAIGAGAGALLALGKLKRLSALALALSLVPTVLTEHQYWTEDDPERRETQRTLLLLKGGLLGALLTMATEPRRTRRLAELRRQTRQARALAAGQTRAVRRQARAELRQARREAARQVRQARRRAAGGVRR